MSLKLKAIKMTFKVGDRVRLLETIGTCGAKAGAEAIVTGDKRNSLFGNDMIYIEWDRDTMHENQDDGGYYPHRFELVTPQIGTEYYEPCSQYRACQDYDFGTNRTIWVVEATRVKTVCTCVDEAEANRIADALNKATAS